MKILSVRLDEHEAARLAALCRRTGLTPSAAVRQGLDALADRAPGNKSMGAVARELGLVGSFDGPADLSENHSAYLRKALRKTGEKRSR